MPQVKILGLIESFGGLALVILFVAKKFVVFCEHKMMISELIGSFYQTEKSHKEVDEEDTKEFEKTQKQKKKVVDEPDGSHKFKLRKTDLQLPFAERIGKLVAKVSNTQRITDEELRTVNQIIHVRQNFLARWQDWVKATFAPYIFYCWKKERRDDHFKKGKRKIGLDLDLRTYLKSIRTLRLLENVLLNDRQRMLLAFQKQKVIQSGSSSESSDFHQEEAILMK